MSKFGYALFIVRKYMKEIAGGAKPYGEKCGECNGEGGRLVWVTDGSNYVRRKKWFTCHKCGGAGFVEPRRKVDCGG